MPKCEGIKKSYDGGLTPVLSGVSLDIKDGEFAVILGASGSGKSTLLNILSGLDKADEGKVLYGQTNLSELTDKQLTLFRRQHVGFIFQQYYLLPHLSVEKNIRLGADLVNNADYLSVAEKLGLSGKLNCRPSQLSGGEQQRVCIARAIAKNPDILFLDEPTGALDEDTGRMVLNYLSDIKSQSKMTMVMVTHNENIADMADTVIKINSGKIKEIYKNERKKTAYEIGW